MKVVYTVKDIELEVNKLKALNQQIGFVPTMGALHAGHMQLVKRAVEENDCCIVSIFVNPTQFNNQSDLEKYPRDLDHDVSLLQQAGCNIVFVPETGQIYTHKEMSACFDFDFGGLDQVMEGKFRPGHFNGVVQIVSKLFKLTRPDKAYFGEKDFQQLAIIHRMVDVVNFNIEIIDCPIVRESSGLAMSSRNERLSEEQRNIAVNISKILSESCNYVSVYSPAELTNWVNGEINTVDGLDIEYFEIVDAVTLQPLDTWGVSAVGCIAVFCGEVRLIDNVRYM